MQGLDDVYKLIDDVIIKLSGGFSGNIIYKWEHHGTFINGLMFHENFFAMFD